MPNAPHDGPHPDGGFPAVVVSAGPDGEAEPTDNTHWVKEETSGNTGSSGARVRLEPRSKPRWVEAEDVNSAADSHDDDLVGTHVWVRCLTDRSGEDEPKYFFIRRAAAVLEQASFTFMGGRHCVYDTALAEPRSDVGVYYQGGAKLSEAVVLAYFSIDGSNDTEPVSMRSAYGAWFTTDFKGRLAASAGTTFSAYTLRVDSIKESWNVGTVTWSTLPAVEGGENEDLLYMETEDLDGTFMVRSMPESSGMKKASTTASPAR